MTTRLLRACAGFLLVVAGAGGVSVAAQAPAGKVQPSTQNPQKKGATVAPAQPAAMQPGAPSAAQQPAPPAVPPPPASLAPPAVERPSGPDAYSYRPEGRRDPFINLVNRAVTSETKPMTKRPDGVRGLAWDEIALRGIFRGPKGAVALVQGPDTKTYRVRVGDQFFDAVIKAITADSLVVLQEVSDPLSLQKQRESRKTLRVAEEVK